MTMTQRLEQCLGETVVYFGDQLDLRIRQGDKEAALKLSMLQEAWRLSVKLLNQSS
jgi:hypothetical protein